jgi:hypothetical protein
MSHRDISMDGHWIGGNEASVSAEKTPTWIPNEKAGQFGLP